MISDLNDLEMAKKRDHKIKKYDFGKAITLFNEAVDKNNKANNLKALQDAADYFLKNSYNVGIDYDNR